MTWDGPVVDSWPTVAHQRIFFGGESATKDAAYAREILARFAEQAWRRPARPAEVARLLKPVEQAQKLGDSFEVAVKNGLMAALCAKSFLYLEEGESARAAPQLSDWELARSPTDGSSRTPVN